MYISSKGTHNYPDQDVGDDEDDAYRQVGSSRHPSAYRSDLSANSSYSFPMTTIRPHADYGQPSYLSNSQLRPASSQTPTPYTPIEGHTYMASYGHVPQPARFLNSNHAGQSSQPLYTTDPSKPYIPLTPEDRRALGAFRVAL